LTPPGTAPYCRRQAPVFLSNPIGAIVSFPVTHLSLVRRAQSADADTRARAQEALAAVYWLPIYSHVRLTHRQEPADAEDLTQGFFADVVRRQLFARYDPARARFRTYVRRCVDSYVANARQAEQRRKRGGDATFVSIDAREVDERLTIEGSRDADAAFEREWVRSILVAALARLRDRYRAMGHTMQLALFEQYDLAKADDDRPTYAALAAEHGIPVTSVTNWLAAVRRDYRSQVIDTLRDVTSSDEEFREELRALQGRESS